MGSAWADLRRAALGAALGLALACQRAEPVGVSAELEVGRRFVAEREFRRAALEHSLVNRDGDARKRLAHYAVDGDWEALPILNPELAPIVAGERPELSTLWSGRIEWSEPALLELGRRAFEEWPAQRAPGFARLVGSAASSTELERDRLADIGAWVDDRGRVAGLVWVKYVDGSVEPALSCASCHARPDARGRLVHGIASELDLGQLTGDAWGPGRVDVTVDGSSNPVAVPDLRATRHQRRLHHAGNLVNSLEALAVRTETLLITARADVARPPREIAFALAYYVWSLGAQRPTAAPPPSALFVQACGRCHSGATGAGELVPDVEVGTDGSATASSARGTGGYRVPSLYGVSQRSRLTHLGWPISLREFLDPSRVGSMPGHAFGFELSQTERESLARELEQW